MRQDGARFVLFIPRMAEAAWWARGLAYQHCYTAEDAGAAGTLVLTHEGRHLRQVLLEEPVGVHLRRLIAAKDAVVLLPPAIAAAPAPMLRPPMTCVEVVKATLGIGAPWIVTPRQLARHLLRRGGRRVGLANPEGEPDGRHVLEA